MLSRISGPRLAMSPAKRTLLPTNNWIAVVDTVAPRLTPRMRSWIVGLVSAFSISGHAISAPFLMFGLLFNLGLGVLARLIPQMQVYFIGVPLSILIGLLILYAVLGSMMGLFLDYAGGVLRDLAPSG